MTSVPALRRLQAESWGGSLSAAIYIRPPGHFRILALHLSIWELCSGSGEGSYLRRTDLCITQLEA